METNTTLLKFSKDNEDFKINSEYDPTDNEERKLSIKQEDIQINSVIQQIRNASKHLLYEIRLAEEDCTKIAFYAFLKKISLSQKININISEYDKALNGKNLNFHYSHRFFLNKVDFLEKIYSRTISINYKKILGQFFTPNEIAEFMSLVSFDKNNQKVLEPALGGGIFISYLNKTSSNKLEVTAIEKDPLCLAMAKVNLSRIKDIDIKYLNNDFLDYGDGRYDLIIANPPYVRFHDIKNREETISKIEKESNIQLSRLINYYALFFLKTGNLLKENGKLVFITPSEFLNVNYGVSVKEFFKKNFDIDSIITFENGALMFEDNLSTACITILKKKNNPDKDKYVKFIKLSNWVGNDKLLKLLNNDGNISEKNFSLTLVKQSELNYKEKWMKYFDSNQKFELTKHNLIKLSDIAYVNRGIATGANEYFLFSHSKITEWGVEKDFLKPVMAKSNFCKFNDFTPEDFESLKKDDKPIYLLYCFSEPSKNLTKFIAYGEKGKINDRYLTSIRTPWYSMEKREKAPIWAGVFSREGVKFILNRTNCLNLTTFHGIYPNFSDEDTLLFLLAYLNSGHCKELMKREMRAYGGGLNKFEPRDLENIPVPNLEKIPKEKLKHVASLFKECMGASRKGQDSKNLIDEIENNISVILHA